MKIKYGIPKSGDMCEYKVQPKKETKSENKRSTSVPGCGEESASYQRDEEINKQKYFLFVGFVELFKRSYDMVILFIHLNGFSTFYRGTKRHIFV
jgi:hypothetical protein